MRRVLSVALILSFFLSMASLACTRVLWKNDKAIISARTMDWYDNDMRENIWVLPRGLDKDGLAEESSLTWVSKYGSMVSMASDTMTVDGFNEKGLAAHTLWLYETDYGKRDTKKPGLSVLMWAQYYLDNFATVDEAVRFASTTDIQIEPFAIPDPLLIHLVLDDASGDSALFEYINGKMHIYHSREYNVMANSPSFREHLDYMKQFKGFGGEKSLPGTDLSLDRFVRATYYTSHLPQPKDDQEMVTEILSVLNNVSMPYGQVAPERPMVSITTWDSIIDLTHSVYYHLSIPKMKLIWADLKKFDLSENAPMMKLDIVRYPDLSGDVTGKFKSTEAEISKFNLSHAPSSRARANQSP